MKRVLYGKVYNTETAVLVGDYSYSIPGDFQYFSEELYRTAKGQFFLAGEGGPMSMYARSIGNNTTSGSQELTLLTDSEALNWCEEHEIDAETIAEYFTVEEG